MYTSVRTYEEQPKRSLFATRRKAAVGCSNCAKKSERAKSIDCKGSSWRRLTADGFGPGGRKDLKPLEVPHKYETFRMETTLVDEESIAKVLGASYS